MSQQTITGESDLAAFTHRAAHLVAANDRRTRRRAFLRSLHRPALLVGVAWSALCVAAFVLVLLPVNMARA